MTNTKISKLVLNEEDADTLAGALHAACEGKTLTEQERDVLARVHAEFKTNDVCIMVDE